MKFSNLPEGRAIKTFNDVKSSEDYYTARVYGLFMYTPNRVNDETNERAPSYAANDFP